MTLTYYDYKIHYEEQILSIDNENDPQPENVYLMPAG